MNISIIVPVYNIQSYVNECVSSLIDQKLEDYEIILVDDGSTDESGAICDALAENHNTVSVIHKANGGPSDARNVGLSIAKGEYILFVDGDDYIEKDILARIFDLCNKQNRPDVMFLRAEKVYPDGTKVLLDAPMDEDFLLSSPKADVLKYIANQPKYPGSACTKMVRRELLLKNSIVFELGKKVEDLDWTKQVLFAASTYGYCGDSYYYYRQNRVGSRSNTFAHKGFVDLSCIIEKWVSEAEESDNIDKQDILFKFAAYEYKVLLGDSMMLPEEKRPSAIEWLEKYKWLLNKRMDSQTKMIRTAVRLVGIKRTALLLKIYLKYRKN